MSLPQKDSQPLNLRLKISGNVNCNCNPWVHGNQHTKFTCFSVMPLFSPEATNTRPYICAHAPAGLPPFRFAISSLNPVTEHSLCAKPYRGKLCSTETQRQSVQRMPHNTLSIVFVYNGITEWGSKGLYRVRTIIQITYSLYRSLSTAEKLSKSSASLNKSRNMTSCPTTQDFQMPCYVAVHYSLNDEFGWRWHHKAAVGNADISPAGAAARF
jgi:hypothetical protein